MGLFNRKKKEENFADSGIAMEQQMINQEAINQQTTKQQSLNPNSEKNSEVIEKSESSNSMEELDEATLMSRDLMIYIGEAISKWAKQYDMEQMPKKLVFKKALTLMNAWDRNSIFK